MRQPALKLTPLLGILLTLNACHLLLHPSFIPTDKALVVRRQQEVLPPHVKELKMYPKAQISSDHQRVLLPNEYASPTLYDLQTQSKIKDLHLISESERADRNEVYSGHANFTIWFDETLSPDLKHWFKKTHREVIQEENSNLSQFFGHFELKEDNNALVTLRSEQTTYTDHPQEHLALWSVTSPNAFHPSESKVLMIKKVEQYDFDSDRTLLKSSEVAYEIAEVDFQGQHKSRIQFTRKNTTPPGFVRTAPYSHMLPPSIQTDWLNATDFLYLDTTQESHSAKDTNGIYMVDSSNTPQKIPVLESLTGFKSSPDQKLLVAQEASFLNKPVSSLLIFPIQVPQQKLKIQFPEVPQLPELSTDSTFEPKLPRWSPDSSKLIFELPQVYTGQALSSIPYSGIYGESLPRLIEVSSLYLIDLKKQSVEKITQSYEGEAQPYWLDKDHILYSKYLVDQSTPGIYKKNIHTLEETLVFEFKGTPQKPEALVYSNLSQALEEAKQDK